MSQENSVINFRLYGKHPFKIAVIHGGPGAPGEMAPVARELSSVSGVLEPFQTAATLSGQVEELNHLLITKSDIPVTLVGWSWGAMLSFIYAARYPSMVKKLILLSSPPFEEQYAAGIMAERLSRLNDRDREESVLLMSTLNSTDSTDKDCIMKRFGELMAKADSYDPLPHENHILECRYKVYERVWEEAAALRRNGLFVNMGKNISCPVAAIHGDYDPHPAQGVLKPLSGMLKDFRFILLEKCGHKPWIEKAARDRFFEALKSEIE